ncbi:MAG: alkaline phosphatase family protein [Planctomycetota bacterium]|jgi:predicted AlkP superfamily pyrophosphatase or phosphodiesterase
MNVKRILYVGMFIFIGYGLLFSNAVTAETAQRQKPKLVLEIVVDQLRGDMPGLVLERCGPGGFRYLAENGIWYDNAHHPHANTETIVGHVTLATGAYPSRHGMVGNVWFDEEKDRLVYNIEDSDYEATGGLGARDMDSEVDYTQVAKTEGRSPKTIITTTFSDELSLFFGSEAKIFAVSGKDRGSVSMAGHMGKAFWYSTKNGQFASSTYYYKEFPKWVNDWNSKKKADAYYGKHWELSRPRETYNYAEQDDRPYENPLDLGYGKVFPHPFGQEGHKYYYTLLMASPVVDELAVDFAKTLVKEEGLGQDKIPDYLSVSLSCTDYVGHLFGPASLESEENLLRLDRTLADLFSFIDEAVGLNHTLIVLSADHGAPEASEYMAEKGLDAGRINIDELDYSKLDTELKKRFGIGKEVIKLTFHPYVYLDREFILEQNLDLEEISRVVAAELMNFDGIAYAIPSTDLAAGRLPDASPIARQVLRNFNPKRSGDIYIIYEPHWGPTYNKDVAAVTHGSPWVYDTYVPIIFAGAGLKAQRISRLVETIDIAPTLSLYLGTKPPSGSVGTSLVEVLQ